MLDFSNNQEIQDTVEKKNFFQGEYIKKNFCQYERFPRDNRKKRFSEM